MFKLKFCSFTITESKNHLQHELNLFKINHESKKMPSLLGNFYCMVIFHNHEQLVVILYTAHVRSRMYRKKIKSLSTSMSQNTVFQSLQIKSPMSCEERSSQKYMMNEFIKKRYNSGNMTKLLSFIKQKIHVHS